MPSDFVLYIDFDSTLFNNKPFAKDLWNALAKYALVPTDKINADRTNHFWDPVLGGYDFAGHVRSYDIDPDIMWNELDEIAKTNYLYDDSVEFIQSLRAERYDPKILTFGEKRFQLAKIHAILPVLQGTDTSKPLEVIVVDRRKGEHIAELHQGQKGALVDDIPDQQLPEGFTEIHLDRARNLPEPLAQPGGFVVSNLVQAKTVIERLHPRQ